MLLNVQTSRMFCVVYKMLIKYLIEKKKLTEKSRECHDHKLQPTHDTKRKRKMTKKNEQKQNKQTNAREAHGPAPSSPREVITLLKRMRKHMDNEHGKTPKHEAPRCINHKATQNKKSA